MILAATMSTVDRADVGLFFSECGAGPLVLLHTGGGGDGEMFRLAGDEPSEWRREAAARVRATGMAVAMQAFAEREAEPPPQWLLDNLSSTETEMFALQLEASVADPPLWDRFPLVAAPTLLVCGELEEYEEGGEPRIAERHLHAAAAQLENGEAFVVPGLAHLAVFWRSDLTLPSMGRFLGEHYPSD